MTTLVNSNNMDLQIERLSKYLETKSNPELMVSHTVLKSISNYKLLFCDYHCIGHPSTIKLSLLIAVGTTKGFIILFDSSQKYLWHHKSVDRGAVSAIDFNHKCSRLLVGYVNGTIIMFDSSSTPCKSLQIINDVLTPHTAVLHLKFTDLPNLAIINDTAGSVFELNFKKTFCKRNIESKMFFCGYPSKVYCIEPLLFNQMVSHPMSGYVIIAMATQSKIIIFALRPNTKLLLSHDITSSRECLPLLSWQFVTTQFKNASNSYYKHVNPLLSFIQGDTVYSYVVKLNEENCLCSFNLRKIKLPYMILAFSWIDHCIFLIMSSLKKVHLINVCFKNEMEDFELLNISLVFTSSFYDCSDDLLLGKCCYSSIHGHNGQLIFLDENNINIIGVRSWTEYLNRLTDQKLFTNALQSGFNILKKKNKPIYNLRLSRAPRRIEIEKKVIDIVTMYIDSMIEINNPVYYKDGIPLIMDVCVYLKNTNILFNHLWNSIELIESSCNVFLECLANYICNYQINIVPTNIIQKLFIYLSLTSEFKKLEKCILNVEIQYLDIDQSVRLVRAHSLHDGLISIWNRALQDFITPLQELVPKMITHGDNNDSTITLGNIILNYLRSSLIGVSYPEKCNISKYLQNKVRSDIVQFLCSQHSIKAKDDEFIYPYLRILLKFNTTKFLNLLKISGGYISSQLKQRIICVLSSIITSNKELKSNQLGYIYLFIVKWQKNEKNVIKLDSNVCETVVVLLTSPEQTVPLEERETILMELISLGEFNNNPNLLKIAVEAKFGRNQICFERGEFSQIFKYSVLDNAKKHQMFRFIRSKPESFDQLTYANVKVLLDIDTAECGLTFGKCHQQYVCDISTQINMNCQKYLFLKGVITHVNLNIRLCPNYLKFLCQYEPSAKINSVRRNNSIHFAKSIATARTTGLDNISNMLLERFGDFEKAFEFIFSQLQEFIQQENTVEECMKVLISSTQRRSVDSNSVLHCFVNLQLHDDSKKVLDSDDLESSSEMQSFINNQIDTVSGFRDHIIEQSISPFKLENVQEEKPYHLNNDFNQHI